MHNGMDVEAVMLNLCILNLFCKVNDFILIIHIRYFMKYHKKI